MGNKRQFILIISVILSGIGVQAVSVNGEEWIRITDELYILKDDVKKVERKGALVTLFNDTLKGEQLIIKYKSWVTTPLIIELKNSDKPKRVKFKVSIIDDIDSLYYKRMLKEVRDYYVNKRDSVLRECFREKNVDTVFIAKSFVYEKEKYLMPFFTDDVDWEGFFFILANGGKVIKIELQNYKYDEKNIYKGRRALTNFMSVMGYKDVAGDYFRLFEASYGTLSPKRRELFEQGVLEIK